MGTEMETQREKRVMESRRDVGAVSLQHFGHSARGVDVELALEDVINDRLAEVIHNVSIPVLQGQSGVWGERKGVRAHLGGAANGDTPLPAPPTCFWWS